MQRRLDRSGECEVFLQRFSFVYEHVGTRCGETLVVDRIAPWIAGCELQRVGDRLGRVAHVFIESLLVIAGRLEAKRAGCSEVKCARRGRLGWPRIEPAPLMRARLEDVGLGRSVIRVALQKVAEERQLNFLAIEHGGLRAQVDVAQFFAVAATPGAVRPRTHDQDIGDSGVLSLRPTIGLQRAE